MENAKKDTCTHSSNKIFGHIVVQAIIYRGNVSEHVGVLLQHGSVHTTLRTSIRVSLRQRRIATLSLDEIDGANWWKRENQTYDRAALFVELKNSARETYIYI